MTSKRLIDIELEVSRLKERIEKLEAERKATVAVAAEEAAREREAWEARVAREEAAWKARWAARKARWAADDAQKASTRTGSHPTLMK